MLYGIFASAYTGGPSLSSVNTDVRITAQKIRESLEILVRVVEGIDRHAITVRGIRAELNRVINGPLTTARVHVEFAGELRSPYERRRKNAATT